MANINVKLDKKAKEVVAKTANISGGTTVIANPELVGDEPELVGLQVGESKYKVPEGGGSEQVQSDWNQENSEAVDFIKNKPTIPAAQVQADWNQSNNQSPDFIKNKPNLAKVATSGKYNDLTGKPTIPAEISLYSVKLRAYNGNDCVELYANYIPFLGDYSCSDAFDCLSSAITYARDELNMYNPDDPQSGLLLIAYFGNGAPSNGPSLYMGSKSNFSVGVLEDGQLEFVKISGTQGPALLSISVDSEATTGYIYDPQDGYSYVHKREY